MKVLKSIQLLKAFGIKFQNFAAHAHKDALINETFIQNTKPIKLSIN